MTPCFYPNGGRDLYVNLGAERTTIAAQKDHFKIAVEIKSFLKPSPVRDLEKAGVSKEDIILGFHPPQVRQYTDFGVA